MKQTESKSDMASAVNVAGRVELLLVKLLACNCKQRPNRPAGRMAFDITRSCRAEPSNDKDALGVVVRFVLYAFGEGEEQQKKKNAFLTIDATFFLLYSIRSLEGLGDKALASFADLNGTYNAWPYWRELVQSITSRMDLPPLTIPVFKLPVARPQAPAKKKKGKTETITKK